MGCNAPRKGRLAFAFEHPPLSEADVFGGAARRVWGEHGVEFGGGVKRFPA